MNKDLEDKKNRNKHEKGQKTINFGWKGMSDYTIHKDKDRRERFYERFYKIKDIKDE